jgi:hypothetical protein
LADAPSRDKNPLGPQERFLELEVATVAAKRTTGRNDTVRGHAAVAAIPHDVPYGS